ncbi:hypothetical protein EX30DRAFT_377010 [Ascodesmis nigricans]|uniref:Uncharacterized protein n=1 Tax=Ascodesmis nigricans TaxID=341454 RepID=A0A4S2N7M6_9PEZI|nr:hypothetical protein EX30DRAFT_377010 [Ascodesmis nigricans]
MAPSNLQQHLMQQRHPTRGIIFSQKDDAHQLYSTPIDRTTAKLQKQRERSRHPRSHPSSRSTTLTPSNHYSTLPTTATAANMGRNAKFMNTGRSRPTNPSSPNAARDIPFAEASDEQFDFARPEPSLKEPPQQQIPYPWKELVNRVEEMDLSHVTNGRENYDGKERKEMTEKRKTWWSKKEENKVGVDEKLKNKKVEVLREGEWVIPPPTKEELELAKRCKENVERQEREWKKEKMALQKRLEEGYEEV